MGGSDVEPGMNANGSTAEIGAMSLYGGSEWMSAKGSAAEPGATGLYGGSEWMNANYSTTGTVRPYGDGSTIEMEEMYNLVMDFGWEDIFSGSGSLISPLTNIEVSSAYGSRGSRRHLGVDLRSPRGTPIHAAEDGVVTTAKYKGSYGNLIILNHGRGLETYYAHCSSMSVSVGKVVKKGDVIGQVGTTGNATGAHLHFEVRLNGVYQNPLNYI
ncbi:hypothetical protein FACS1894127_0850 [Clostridia bacterium]|nr:hypothetical protein FACS1894127_0850 [Clostridia bacterium]